MTMTPEMTRTCLVVLLTTVLCFNLVDGFSSNGIERPVSKRYAMMDLALNQIYDICDRNGDRMLTFPELRCVQEMGHSILGRRKK